VHILYHSPLGGGINMSWDDLVNLFLYERNAVIEVVEERQKTESENFIKLMGGKPR
jgi:hypothetical protein